MITLQIHSWNLPQVGRRFVQGLGRFRVELPVIVDMENPTIILLLIWGIPIIILLLIFRSNNYPIDMENLTILVDL